MKKLQPTKLFMEKELQGHLSVLFSNNLQITGIVHESGSTPRVAAVPLYNTKDYILYDFYKPISKSIDINLLINTADK